MSVGMNVGDVYVFVFFLFVLFIGGFQAIKPNKHLQNSVLLSSVLYDTNIFISLYTILTTVHRRTWIRQTDPLLKKVDSRAGHL